MITSNQFYINIKDKPYWNNALPFEKQTRDAQQFMIAEAKKLKNGLYIGGVKIHPWLYWHTNFWHMMIDELQPDGSLIPLDSVSNLRDTEWMLQEALIEAETNRKGIAGGGSRRIAKSAFMSSYLAYRGHTIYGGALRVNSIVGGSQDDLDNIIDYVEYGMDNLHPFFKMDRVGKNWEHGVTLGTRNIDNSKEIFSKFTITNVNSGAAKSNQKSAGATPLTFIMDEALKWNEPVLTSEGFKNIQDIKVGDKVFGADGCEANVVDKIDVGVKPLYKLVFSNGTEIECCGDHLWEFIDFYNGGITQVYNTLEVFNKYKKDNEFHRFSVKRTEPVKFGHKNALLEPYMLGVWLICGNFDISILCPNDYILQYVQNYAGLNELSVDIHHFDGDVYTCNIKDDSQESNILVKGLKKYGLFAKRYIPKQYLFNSIGIRFALLQGIVDSCGYINDEGGVELFIYDEQLRNDVVTLINSLGLGLVKEDIGVLGNTVFKLIISTDLELFRNPMMLGLQKQRRKNKLRGYIDLVDIYESTPSQAYCLKVDSPNNLFLTRDFIPTHNCGKFPCLKTLNVAKYSLATQYGWRTSPILMGCVCKGTKVWDKNGVLRNIEDITKETGILGYDGKGCSVENIPWIQEPKQKKCVSIKIDLGKNLECSEDHPILVSENGKAVFKQAVDIKEGDYVLLSNSKKIFGTKKGHIVDIDTLEELPSDIWEWNEESVVSLLKEFFNKKAFISFSKNKFRIILNFRNDDLLRSFQNQLERFGIYSYVFNEGHWRGVRLVLTKTNNLILFRDLIGFDEGYKKELLDKKLSISEKHDGYEFEKTLEGKGDYFVGLDCRNVSPYKVTSVVPIGYQDIYNLEAGVTHTYLTDGFISHNTSGNLTQARDFQKILTNPSEYNMITMNWDWLERRCKNPTWSRQTFGVFFPGQMSLEGSVPKRKTTLGEFLGNDSFELSDIYIYETPWEEKTKEFTERRDKLKKVDVSTYNDELMHIPLNPEEMFMEIGKNPFPAAEATAHLRRIRESGDVGRVVDFLPHSDNSGKVDIVDSDKPIADFPFEGGILDCGIKVFEAPPADNSMDYIYVGGLDHYKHTESTGDSIGALYIYKRKVNINDSYEDSIVCSYVSRPPSMNTFNRKCEIILEAYGAQCLQENADISFQQFLEAKNKDIKLLANGQEIVTRMINPNGRQVNKYGLAPTVKNKEYLLNLVISYCQEPIEEYLDKDGTEIKILGVERIKDEQLLQEIIDYKPGKNVDRIVAFGHALIWARYLDDIRVMPKIKGKKTSMEYGDEKYQEKQHLLQDMVRSKYGNVNRGRGYSKYGRRY